MTRSRPTERTILRFFVLISTTFLLFPVRGTQMEMKFKYIDILPFWSHIYSFNAWFIYHFFSYCFSISSVSLRETKTQNTIQANLKKFIESWYSLWLPARLIDRIKKKTLLMRFFLFITPNRPFSSRRNHKNKIITTKRKLYFQNVRQLNHEIWSSIEHNFT